MAMCPIGATAAWCAPWVKGTLAAGVTTCPVVTVLNVNILPASASPKGSVSAKQVIKYVAAMVRHMAMFVR